MCQTLGVSASGYYAWASRAPSARSLADGELTQRIKRIHEESRETYGMPRVHAELSEQGVHVSRKRVARLIAAGLQGISRRKWIRTTERRPGASPAPDLVDRDFTAAGPDRLWVADITYIATWAGFLYLSVVLDAWSRRVVGWAMATHLRTELVLDALNMAIWRRRPALPGQFLKRPDPSPKSSYTKNRIPPLSSTPPPAPGLRRGAAFRVVESSSTTYGSRKKSGAAGASDCHREHLDGRSPKDAAEDRRWLSPAQSPGHASASQLSARSSLQLRTALRPRA
jgi:hypothetical protein